MAFLGENINSNSDKDVRSALKPLKQLAERTGAAILIIRHLNKTPGSNVLYRGGGSIGIIGAARSGLIVGPHPEDEEQRVLASQKHNLSTPGESGVRDNLGTGQSQHRGHPLQGRSGYERPRSTQATC